MAEHDVRFRLFYDGVWNDADAYTRSPITYRRGSTKPYTDTDPGEGTATLDNRSGDYSPRSAASRLRGKIGQNTKTQIWADNSIRMMGEATSWKPQRAVKGDAWTDVQVAGVLQRIGRGTDPLRSPIYRSTAGANPVAYWPLEDGNGSTRFASGLADGEPMGIDGTVSFAADATLLGSTANPTVGSDVYAYAPIRHTFNGHWQVDWFIHFPDELPNEAPVIRIWTKGGVAYWDIRFGFNTHFVRGYDGYGNTLVTGGPFITPDYLFQGWTHMRFQVRDNGGGVLEYLFTEFPVPLGTGNFIGGTMSAAFGDPYYVQLLPSADLQGVGYGHIAVYDDYDFSAVDQSAAGYLGEAARTRFLRLCQEEGIPAYAFGSATFSTKMGAQRSATLLELLDEIARTDDALIFETRDDLALTMRTCSHRQNQTPLLTLSYLGDIQPGLEPVYGDEGIRNDVTAVNPAGSWSRIEKTTGPHNVSLPEVDPQGVGRYKTRLDVNPQTDVMLADAAGWRINIGTHAGTWYAEVTVDLEAVPALISAVNAVDIGDVIRLTDLPVDEALESVDCMVIGIAEVFPAKGRLVTFYCVPAAPYRVGIMANDTGDVADLLGRLDTDGATTATTVAVGAGSFQVVTPSGPLWTTTADDFPLDVIVGGQRVSISNITGASSPQTFTVQPTGKQVRYTISAGAQVNVADPIILIL